MKKKSLIIMSLLILSCFANAQVYQWRGPDRNGIIPEKGLLKTWPEEGPELLWSFKDLGEGHTSVGPSKDRLFITGLEGSTGFLFAFDYNGNLIWKVPYGPEWTENYIGPRSTPVVNEDRVYIQSGHGVVYCINAGTGKTIWSVDLLKEYSGKKITWGLVENLLIVGDKIICTPGGLTNNVVALNRLTGKLIWSSPGNGRASAYCSSIYVKHNKTELIVTTTDGSIIGIDANTGKAYWNFPQHQNNNIHANTPLYTGGVIYCATEKAGSDNGLIALRLSDDGTKVTQLWRNREFMNLMEGFILMDGLIYGSVYQARKWLCIDAKSGTVIHSFSGLGDGIILWADGLFYCYTKNGEVALVSADRNNFEIISRFRLPMGDGPHFSHPVIHKGKMYIRHGSALMVYRITAY
jgi:outer membrane protein assembly factor BamB